MSTNEPIYTRTLAELYIKQGFDEKALEVYRFLRRHEPDAEDLRTRIEALEAGSRALDSQDVLDSGGVDAEELADEQLDVEQLADEELAAEERNDEQFAAEERNVEQLDAEERNDEQFDAEDAEEEEEVETLARDLAQSGHEEPRADSPFAWNEDAGDGGAELSKDGDGESDIGSYFDGLLGWEEGTGS